MAPLCPDGVCFSHDDQSTTCCLSQSLVLYGGGYVPYAQSDVLLPTPFPNWNSTSAWMIFTSHVSFNVLYSSPIVTTSRLLFRRLPTGPLVRLRAFMAQW